MRLKKGLILVITFTIILLFVPSQKTAAQFYENIEWQILEFVNYERAINGQPLLQMDSKLRDLARAHSKDMGDNNFYDHTSPTTGTFVQRLQNNGVSFNYAAENIHKFQWGCAHTAMYDGTRNIGGVTWTVYGWMGSTGHRNNILSPNSNYTGIGVYRSNDGKYSYTQKFVGWHSPPSYIVTPRAWRRLAPEIAGNLNYDGGKLAVAFKDIGVWCYDGGWSRLAPENALALDYDGGKLAVAFEGIGVWEYANATWTRLAPENAVALAYDGGILAVAFESIGVWLYSNNGWSRLAPEKAVDLAFAEGRLAIAFADIGVWHYGFGAHGGIWTRVAPENAVALDYDGNNLAVAFEDIGVWLISGSGWSRLATGKAVDLAYDNGSLVVAFEGIGVWLYDGGWTRLAPEKAIALAYDAGSLAVAFENIGVWCHE